MLKASDAVYLLQTFPLLKVKELAHCSPQGGPFASSSPTLALVLSAAAPQASLWVPEDAIYALKVFLHMLYHFASSLTSFKK